MRRIRKVLMKRYKDRNSKGTGVATPSGSLSDFGSVATGAGAAGVSIGGGGVNTGVDVVTGILGF